jgi:hypothetical protein
MLVIETGMHNETITGMAADAEGENLFTVSTDKTLRVWELKTGKLLRTIRVPRGQITEAYTIHGVLNAVALSPDGKTVATGGVQSEKWEQWDAIYLFDWRTGKMTHRLRGFAANVLDLEFSRDGRWLVAGSGTQGVRLIDMQKLALAGTDREYEARCTDVVITPDNHIITASPDGALRLYEIRDGLRRLNKIEMKDSEPFSLSLSPDGTKLAVGYLNQLKVDVLDARTLALQSTMDVVTVKSTLGAAQLHRVTWSADGKSLYAAGNYLQNAHNHIRRWTLGSKALPKDLPITQDLLTQLLTLKDGTVVFGTSEGGLGLMEKDGSTRWNKEPNHLVFVGTDLAATRRMMEGLKTYRGNSEEDIVQFVSRNYSARFHVRARKLELNPESDSQFEGPLTDWKRKNRQYITDELDITDWFGSPAPKLNGKPMELHPGELSLSFALNPTGSDFYLGTTAGLRYGDVNRGQPLREAEYMPPVRSVCLAGGINLLLGDGRVRFRKANLFAHPDGRRWVFWMDGGIYMCSPGGEDLIGWHINNGPNREASFIPAGNYRKTYYHPEVFSEQRLYYIADWCHNSHCVEIYQERLQTKLEQEQKQQRIQKLLSVAQSLPPVVDILSPYDNETSSKPEVKMQFSVKTPSDAPVTRIRILIDGRPIAATRGLGLNAASTGSAGNVPLKDGEVREISVALPPQDCEVSILAENKNAVSAPATVRIRRRAANNVVVTEPTTMRPSTTTRPPITATTAANKKTDPTTNPEDGFEIRPKLYVLAVGVSKYASAQLQLGFPSKDAQDFAHALLTQKGMLYRDVVVKVLTDGNATKDAVLDGLEWIQKETTSKDVAMILLAGHGVNDASGLYYFLPYNTDLESLKRTGVPFTDIKSTVSSVAGKMLMFVDTCHSGNVMGIRRAVSEVDIAAFANELASAESGAVVFAASTGSQYSLEKAEWGNGAFTKALVEGLLGKADYAGKGKITINMLDLYLSERVKELTGGKQTPTTTKPQTIADFPVAVRK